MLNSTFVISLVIIVLIGSKLKTEYMLMFRPVNMQLNAVKLRTVN